MSRTGLAVALLGSVVLAGCGGSQSSVFAAHLSAFCKEGANEGAALASGQLPNSAKVVATVRRLTAVKPPPSERIVYRKFLLNGVKLDKAWQQLFKAQDSSHLATVHDLVDQINREATQLHASACRIAWP